LKRKRASRLTQRVEGNYLRRHLAADASTSLARKESRRAHSGPGIKLLAENKLDGGFMASPAVFGKALYLSQRHTFTAWNGDRAGEHLLARGAAACVQRGFDAVFHREKLGEIGIAIEAIAERKCPGGVLIEHRGVAYHRAYGSRGSNRSESTSEDTIFDAASSRRSPPDTRDAPAHRTRRD
jgi:hypothetical protein